MSVAEPVTKIQVGYIKDLLREAGDSGSSTLTFYGGGYDAKGRLDLSNVDKPTASKLIKSLLAGRVPTGPAPTGNGRATPVRRGNGRAPTPRGRRPARTGTSPAGDRLRAAMKPRPTPTPEQAHIIGFASTPVDGEYPSLIVEAGAGTGKTTTLLEVCRAMPDRRGLFTTFTRSIVDDADRKFPKRLPGGGGVECLTMHSLAWWATDRVFRERQKTRRRILPETIAKRLGIGVMRFTVPNVDGTTTVRVIKAGVAASIVMAAINRFCQSADRYPDRRHFGRQEGLDPEGVWDNHNILFDALKRHLPVVWADLCEPDGWIPYTFAHMLKCQPPGTLITKVVRRGGNNKHTGESWDTEWTQIPIEDLVPGDEVVSWSGTFISGYIRKTGRPITRTGSRRYDGTLITATTPMGHSSSYTHDHICIARIPERLADGNHIVYMMRRGSDYRIGRTPWTFKSSKNTVFGPINRAWTQGADGLWILSIHQTDRDAALAEALAQHEFNIPGWQFKSTNEFMPLDQFWAKAGNNREAASRCLISHGRDIQYPFWEKAEYRSRARPAEIRACNLLNGMEVCDIAAVTPVTSGQSRSLYTPGSKAWQPVTVTRSPYSGEVYSIEVDVDHTYVADGIVTHNCWSLTDPVLPYDYALIDECQDIAPVMMHVIEVQIARGMQVIAVGDSFQAINEWTGAVDALQQFDIPDRARLTQSFRFGHLGAVGANWILERLGDFRLVGNPNVATEVRAATSPVRCTLHRTNASAVTGYMDDRSTGGRPHLVGGGADIRWFCQYARILQLGEEAQSLRERLELIGVPPAQQATILDSTAGVEPDQCPTVVNTVLDDPTEPQLELLLRAIAVTAELLSDELSDVREHPDLACFDTWSAVREFVNEYEDGKEIKLQVKLVDRFGAMQIVRSLKSMPDEADATSIHSTAHKVKGREWETVALASDFTAAIEECDIAELRLLYVAFTRGMLLIDPTPAACLTGLMDAVEEARLAA